MDVGAANATDNTNIHVDPVGSRCQKLFQDFLEEWQEGEELKYLKVRNMVARTKTKTKKIMTNQTSGLGASKINSVKFTKRNPVF